MPLNLAEIDALGLIHEKAKIMVKCITLEDIDIADIRLLAYIADDFLDELWDTICG
ncbi:MAG: hypothetical protein FWE40_06345 [Oscillospiraceae bacterium]|nr:hypothetical protein [Oscillospiraceae bacterium]